MPFCSHCGVETTPGDRFCAACGARLSEGVPTAVPTVTPTAVKSSAPFAPTDVAMTSRPAPAATATPAPAAAAPLHPIPDTPARKAPPVPAKTDSEGMQETPYGPRPCRQVTEMPRASEHSPYSDTTSGAGTANATAGQSGLVTAIKVFSILACTLPPFIFFLREMGGSYTPTVLALLCFVSLLWKIPMACTLSGALRRGTPISTGRKVATLLFLSPLTGILLFFLPRSNAPAAAGR